MRFIFFNIPNNMPKCTDIIHFNVNVSVNVSVSWHERLGLGRLETCFLNVSVSSRLVAWASRSRRATSCLHPCYLVGARLVLISASCSPAKIRKSHQRFSINSERLGHDNKNSDLWRGNFTHPLQHVRAKQMFCNEAATRAAFQRMRTFEDTNSVFIVLSYYHSFRLVSR